MNKTFVSFQRKDHPHIVYGATGTLHIGGFSKKLKFLADGGERGSFITINPSDVYTYGKKIKDLITNTNTTSISG